MCTARDAKQDAHGSESGAVLQLIEHISLLADALAEMARAIEAQSQATMQLCRTSADLIQMLAVEQGDETDDGEPVAYLSGALKR